ncbi:MAG TPA: G/U mismatch-specific DNA glycosylase [Blastocatellia bacterium]|nr:G/U mismatch-specific DNA glycosylase [Blastocatellia bacterium]
MSKTLPVYRPTKDELVSAYGKPVRDVIGRELQVLFCGINPGLYSAAVGHHFARPGNRFWPALFSSGFTDRLFSPFEERDLLKLGYGITNIVERATASAAELSAEELAEGSKKLIAKVRHYRPRYLAVLGIGAYGTAFGRRDVELGLQEERIGDSKLWVLPNPSGLNAHYRPADLARLFRDLRIAMEDQ